MSFLYLTYITGWRCWDNSSTCLFRELENQAAHLLTPLIAGDKQPKHNQNDSQFGSPEDSEESRLSA